MLVYSALHLSIMSFISAFAIGSLCEISAEYNIVKVPMDNVTISDIDNWTKLGTAPNPAVTVTYNNVTLHL